MATIPYVCKDCGHKFYTTRAVHLQSRDGIGKIACPKCLSERTIRTFTEVPTIIFKGPGFTKRGA